MNLEKLEQVCLAYLSQATNPLTPIRALHAHCKRDEDFAQLTERELIEFLRPHEEVTILEGPAPGEAVDSGMFAEAGIEMGPRAILRQRMPAARDLILMMDQQLDVMLKTLEDAQEQAERDGEESRLAQLSIARARAEMLRQRMHDMVREQPGE